MADQNQPQPGFLDNLMAVFRNLFTKQGAVPTALGNAAAQGAPPQNPPPAQPPQGTSYSPGLADAIAAQAKIQKAQAAEQAADALKKHMSQPKQKGPKMGPTSQLDTSAPFMNLFTNLVQKLTS